MAGSGQRLWFVDTARRLATIDTTTGVVTDVAQLPLDGSFTRLLLGVSHVYVIDQGKGRISTLSMKSGTLETIAFPFANTARGFAVGTDDRIWLAGGDSSSVLSVDPGAKSVAAIDFQTSGISALYVDSAARVWYADDATGGIGYYDQVKRAIVSVGVPAHASVTALSMDRNGTLWAGTTAGQVLSVRVGVAVIGPGAGGPVVDLVRDASGAVWSYAAAPGTMIYRSLTAGGGARIAAVAASSVALDGLGRAWLADPAGAGFYIALNEER